MIKYFLLLCIGLTVLLHSVSAQATWYATTGWTYRKAITIDHTKVGTGPHTNFPVLVNLTTDTQLAAYAQDDSDDILFTSSDGTTKLAHQIEKFDGTTGQLVAWVSVPSLASATDTVIYMYYGNASATSQQNATGTWNSNFKGVWHMGDGTTFSGADITSNANNSSANNGTTAAAGQVYGAGEFNGSSNWLNINSGSVTGLTGNYTLSVWVYVTAFPTSGNNAQLFYFTDYSNYAYLQVFNSAGTLQLQGGLWPGGAAAWNISGWSTNTWHLISYIYNGSTSKVYFDGVEKASAACTTGAPGTPHDFRLAAGENGGPLYYLSGRLDEGRAVGAALDVNWLLTEYNNQGSPSTFYTLGPQERRRVFTTG